MKLLKNAVMRFSRAKDETPDAFDLRLQSLSKPLTKRVSQQAQAQAPVLFRRAMKSA